MATPVSTDADALTVLFDAFQLTLQAEQRTVAHNEVAIAGLDRLLTAAEQCGGLFFQMLAQKRAEFETLQRQRTEDKRLFETHLQEDLEQIRALQTTAAAQDAQLRALLQENAECQRTITELDRRLQNLNTSVQ